MSEFVSEAITPDSASFDLSAMGRGEPGLPGAFRWRGVTYDVVDRLEQWKQSAREGGKRGGELYLRRHYYRLRMSDGAVWTVYFVRQTPKSGSAKQRWFLHTVDRETACRDGSE